MIQLPFVYFRRAHLVILSYLDSHQEGRRADLEVCVRGNVPFVCYLDINEMLVFICTIVELAFLRPELSVLHTFFVFHCPIPIQRINWSVVVNPARNDIWCTL